MSNKTMYMQVKQYIRKQKHDIHFKSQTSIYIYI